MDISSKSLSLAASLKSLFDPPLESSDTRIPYVHLALEKDLPDHFDELPLPEGYHFVSYQPEDRDDWIQIEYSAKALQSIEQGTSVWERYYGRWESILPDRMFFIENEKGEKVATATAIFDTFKENDGEPGWLHWVAIRREDQGKGLARPLIAHTLNRLIELGYRRGHISTQTTTWVAARLYLDFGFLPEKENAVTAEKGWRILRTLTDHPSLSDFEALPLKEFFN